MMYCCCGFVVEVASLAQEIVSTCDRLFFPTIVSRATRLHSRLDGAGVLELQIDYAAALSSVDDDSVCRVDVESCGCHLLPCCCFLGGAQVSLESVVLLLQLFAQSRGWRYKVR
jgi:hypothetical protein